MAALAGVFFLLANPIILLIGGIALAVISILESFGIEPRFDRCNADVVAVCSRAVTDWLKQLVGDGLSMDFSTSSC